MRRLPVHRVALPAGAMLFASTLFCATAMSQEQSQAQHDRRIDYIEMPATDIEKTKRFYVDAFGWKFTDYGPDYTAFEDGRLTGGLRKAERGGGGGTLVVIYAVDLGAAEAGVKKAGGRIVRPIFSFPGGRRFHFTDPSGNELAVWSDK